MADNYLERRMEEYRMARQAGGVKKHAVPLLKRGRVTVDYPAMRVLVANADNETGQAVVDGLRRMGCRVAITARDSRRGTLIAQRSGSQFHPGSVAEALSRLEGAGDPVSVIADIEGLVESTFCRVIVPPAQVLEQGPDAVASWCVFAAHPSNVWLDGVKF